MGEATARPTSSDTRLHRLPAIAMFAAAVVTMAVGFRAWQDVRDLSEGNRVVERVLAVSDSLSTLVALVNNAEGGHLDYLLTGNDAHLEPYRLATSPTTGVTVHLRTLQTLLENEADQLARVESLGPLLQQHLSSIERAISAAVPGELGAGGLPTAVPRQHLLNRIRELALQVRRDEEAVLQEQSTHAARRSRVTYLELAAAAMASLLTLGGAFLLMRRELVQRRRAQAALLATNAELDARVAGRTRELALAKEQLDEQVRRLTSLRAIDLAILGSVDTRLSMKVVLDEMTARLGVELAACYLYDPTTLMLTPFALLGTRSDRRPPVVRLGDGISGRAAVERRTIGVPDVRDVELPPELRAFLAAESVEMVFATPAIAKGELLGVCIVMRREPFTVSPEWIEFFEALAGQAAIAIDAGRAADRLQRAHLDLSMAYDRTMEGWSRALDYRDQQTEGHTRRVTELTLQLARRAGIRDDQLLYVKYGALLHDIGKLGVPDSILLKEGPLTDGERAVMKRHPTLAVEMLSPIEYLRPALDIPYCHHERWDGTGYPRGLKGEQIPLVARLFAVADVWDALTSDRPYRRAWDESRAIEYLRDEASRHFDPIAVDHFLALKSERGATQHVM